MTRGSTASTPRRRGLAAGEEVAGGVVHQEVQRPLLPDRRHQPVDLGSVAQVAGNRAAAAGEVGVELGPRLLEHVLAPPADDELRAELQHAPAHRLAEAGAATGDQDALALQEIALEHGAPFITRSEEHTSELQSLM